MAPTRLRESSNTNPADHDEFIARLKEYHAKRGTNFDPEPKVGSKQIDLLVLYNAVLSRGGYDKVSDEKLAWRKLGSEFGLPSNNLPALSFGLKSIYYKYLAAYEISTVHNKEPPPREILEDITAKGGSLLTRTLENFQAPTKRDSGVLGENEVEGSGDDGTPARDSAAGDDTLGSGGRATRGLRQAPPQRVLFQPDTMSTRQTRQSTGATAPPQSRASAGAYNTAENASVAVASYEPRQQMPLTIRPVVTPGNSPAEWARRQRLLKEAAGVAKSTAPQRIMLPGTGFDGPNIYVRCLLALKSGIPSEQDYALHHLVKISMERGDKYKFESFPGLAEALITKALEVSSLFYDVDWDISYTETGGMHKTHTLDGLEGTGDLLRRIENLMQKSVDDNIQAATFSDRLLQVNEAALTLRNMVMLEENAVYASELYPLRDFLSIVLNLPELESVVELKHYALDIAEQITKYLQLGAEDPLYRSLLAHLNTSDRGAILTSLRAISRIAMNLDERNRLENVPVSVLQRILDWTLLDDEELVTACLDFLYQYTAIVDNVDFLLNSVNLEDLISQLTRLLLHGARSIDRDFIVKQEKRRPAPSDMPSIPPDLLQQLNKLEEPERSSHWLRCLFEEDKDEFITQIALWQAYQQRFSSAVQETGRALLPAADFIKNVSTTFAEKASAQVQPGPVQKFIIKGIRMRSVPVDLKGREYTPCLWRVAKNGVGPAAHVCGEFFMSPEQLFDHILASHIRVSKDAEGKYKNLSSDRCVCLWKNCHKYPQPTAMKLSQLASHIKLHLPRTRDGVDGQPPAKRHKASYIEPAVRQSFNFQETLVDEQRDAAGIPLAAVLVLRNLARNIPKTDTAEEPEEVVKSDEPRFTVVENLFKPVESQLWEVFAHNKALFAYMSDLMRVINREE